MDPLPHQRFRSEFPRHHCPQFSNTFALTNAEPEEVLHLSPYGLAWQLHRPRCWLESTLAEMTEADTIASEPPHTLIDNILKGHKQVMIQDLIYTRSARLLRRIKHVTTSDLSLVHQIVHRLKLRHANHLVRSLDEPTAEEVKSLCCVFAIANIRTSNRHHLDD